MWEKQEKIKDFQNIKKQLNILINDVILMIIVKFK